jgi:D-aminoacyl-tRNA deacylase
MRIVIQRVKEASVTINEKVHARIGQGLVVLLGIEENDQQEDVEWLCSKITRLRIFDDENGVMNVSVSDVNGEMLVISQFTLHASTRKGNRPSYIKAARPEVAIPLYEQFIAQLKSDLGASRIHSGIFGAMMDVSLVNAGPVTIIMDSKNKE